MARVRISKSPWPLIRRVREDREDRLGSEPGLQARSVQAANRTTAEGATRDLQPGSVLFELRLSKPRLPLAPTIGDARVSGGVLAVSFQKCR